MMTEKSKVELARQLVQAEHFWYDCQQCGEIFGCSVPQVPGVDLCAVCVTGELKYNQDAVKAYYAQIIDHADQWGSEESDFHRYVRAQNPDPDFPVHGAEFAARCWYCANKTEP